MANALGQNPIMIDTPGATVLFNSNVKVFHFEYAGYTAQGNLCIVQNMGGHEIWRATGAADLEEVRSAMVGWVNGIIVPTLQGGGFLKIYISP